MRCWLPAALIALATGVAFAQHEEGFESESGRSSVRGDMVDFTPEAAKAGSFGLALEGEAAIGLGQLLRAGTAYQIGVWLRAADPAASIELAIQTSDGVPVPRSTRTHRPQSGEWQFVEWEFLHAPASHRPAELAVRVESGEGGVHLDDLVIMPLGDWRSRAQSQGRAARTGPIRMLLLEGGVPVAEREVRVQQRTIGFAVGLRATSEAVLEMPGEAHRLYQHLLALDAPPDDWEVWGVGPVAPAGSLAKPGAAEDAKRAVAALLAEADAAHIVFGGDWANAEGLPPIEDLAGILQAARDADPGVRILVEERIPLGDQQALAAFADLLERLLAAGAPIDGAALRIPVLAAEGPAAVIGLLDAAEALPLPIVLTGIEFTGGNRTATPVIADALLHAAFGNPAVEGVFFGAEFVPDGVDEARLKAAMLPLERFWQAHLRSSRATTTECGMLAFDGMPGLHEIRLESRNGAPTTRWVEVPAVGDGAEPIVVELER